MSRKRLAALVLAGIATTLAGGIASAADSNVTTLDEVVINSDRYNDSSVLPGGKTDRKIHSGIYDNTDVMDVPANINSYTEKTIKQSYLPARTFFNVVTNNPSISVGGASTNNNVELQIRGIPFNEHDITINGLTGMMEMGITPLNWVERVDTIVGPNVVNAGVGENQSVSGYIDFVPKIAKDTPNFDVSETFSTHRLFTHAIDYGQRFGNNNRWGIRINAEHYNGTTSFDHETVKGNDFYINVDQKTKSSKTSLLFGYDKVENRGMPEVLSFKGTWNKGVTHLPSADKVVENFMPSWTKMGHQRHLYMFTHEQKINDHILAYVKGGYQKVTWPDYWDAKPVLRNDDGTYTLGSIDSDWQSIRTRRSFNGGFIFDFKTGSLAHKVNLGYEIFTRSYEDMKPTNRNSSSSMIGNIYTGDWSKWSDSPVDNGGKYTKTSSLLNRSYLISDTISALSDKLKFTFGVRHQELTTKGFNKNTGKQTSRYSKSKNSPHFGLLYKVTDNTSVYANYAEGLISGGTVATGNHYRNEGAVLSPVSTKQYEFGVKHDFGNWVTALDYFFIKQPVAMEDSSHYYGWSGKTHNQGVEWNIAGKVSQNLTLTGGFMILNAKYKDDTSATTAGKRVYGTPKFNATMGLDWETPVKGLVINGRMVHFGSSYADHENQIRVPSWTRFDLGATYDTHIMKIPFTFSLNAYNVFDRHYWSSTTGKWSQYMVMLNPGRTFVLSATAHC